MPIAPLRTVDPIDRLLQEAEHRSSAPHRPAARYMQSDLGQDRGDLLARPGAAKRATASGGTGWTRSFVERGLQRTDLRTARHLVKTHALCADGPPSGGGRTLGALQNPGYRLVQDLLAAKRDLALPRTTPQARQLRLPAAGRPRLPAPGCRGIGGALHAHRRTLRTAGPWESPPIWSCSQWEHIFANPMSNRGGHRPGGPPLGHPGIRGPQLPHWSGSTAGSETGGEPEGIIAGTG